MQIDFGTSKAIESSDEPKNRMLMPKKHLSDEDQEEKQKRLKFDGMQGRVKALNAPWLKFLVSVLKTTLSIHTCRHKILFPDFIFIFEKFLRSTSSIKPYEGFFYHQNFLFTSFSETLLHNS